MSQVTKTTNQLTVKDIFSRTDVKSKFEEMLGKRSTQFITSVLQIVNNNALLKDAEPMSIYNAAATAATLDLPINNNLGFAYIIPFRDRDRGQVAQFQIGYKGFIQLAQRSGQFLTISASEIYEGQIISENPLKGYEFDFNVKSDKIVGYAAYFKLINGYEATLYMSIQQLEQHGKKFSQTYKKGFGLWKDDFDSMAKKTVIKLLLSKYAPLSVEIQRAVVADQAIINDVEGEDVTYADNQTLSLDDINNEKEKERVIEHINSSESVEDLEMVQLLIDKHDLVKDYETKLKELTNGTK